MKAIDILTVVLNHTVDAPYTVEQIEETSAATIVIVGHYRIDEGLIEDQLTIGLRTYFRLTKVWTSVNPDNDGWLSYAATMQRQPALARVPLDVTQ